MWYLRDARDKLFLLIPWEVRTLIFVILKPKNQRRGKRRCNPTNFVFFTLFAIKCTNTSAWIEKELKGLEQRMMKKQFPILKQGLSFGKQDIRI